MEIPKEIELLIFESQRDEITEYYIYKELSKNANGKNKEILEKIAKDELGHYNWFKTITKAEIEPDKFKIWKYKLMSKIFGLTFAIKKMEYGENDAQKRYEKIAEYLPEIKTIINDEIKHEKELIDLIEEEKLNYVGSIVLGLNDALVELTGALAGLTLAFQNAKIIGITGLITGIAASISMAASEYLSQKADGNNNALKAALYTGFAYIFTVAVLIAPFLILNNPYISIMISLLSALLIIAGFTYYVSITKERNFKKDFLEMSTISLGVAFISFIIGYLVRILFNVDI